MSQQQQTKAASLPDPDTAYQHLFNTIHQQVFFNKMAAYGHPVQSEEHARKMLKQAGQLCWAEEQEMLKQAQDAGNPYDAAGEYLDQHVGDLGYKQAEYPEDFAAIKAAAADLAQDPDIYNCVLSLKAAEAENYLAQTGQRG